jgi:hypothetical protein
MGPVRGRCGASQPLRLDRPAATAATASTSTASSTSAASAASAPATASASATCATATSTAATTSSASTSAATTIASNTLRRPEGARVTARGRETEDPAAAVLGRHGPARSLEESRPRDRPAPASGYGQAARLCSLAGRRSALVGSDNQDRIPVRLFRSNADDTEGFVAAWDRAVLPRFGTAPWLTA